MTSRDDLPDAAASADAASRERTRAAFARLGAVLTDVASSLTAKMHERCPYRARDDRCTFAGGCRNQQRRTAERADDGPGATGRDAVERRSRTLWCGGDHLLQRTRA